MFPVQQVATIVASRAAKLFLTFFFPKKFLRAERYGLFLENFLFFFCKNEKNSLQTPFLVTRLLHGKQNFFFRLACSACGAGDLQVGMHMLTTKNCTGFCTAWPSPLLSSSDRFRSRSSWYFFRFVLRPDRR